jgi:hypothetical protein
VQLLGQFPRRWQALAVAHVAAQDRGAKPEINLPRQRFVIFLKWY